MGGTHTHTPLRFAVVLPPPNPKHPQVLCHYKMPQIVTRDGAIAAPHPEERSRQGNVNEGAHPAPGGLGAPKSAHARSPEATDALEPGGARGQAHVASLCT